MVLLLLLLRGGEERMTSSLEKSGNVFFCASGHSTGCCFSRCCVRGQTRKMVKSTSSRPPSL